MSLTPSFFRLRRTLTGAFAASAVMAAGLSAPVAAHAKEGELRIAQQFGIVYLLLNVAQEQKLIESTARHRAWISRWSCCNFPVGR